MVIFGWYAFTIKNYTRDELFQLGIAPENMGFLIKQKVAHVFWIPLFPIGKQYVLKRDGKNYEMPGVLISKLKSIETPKTPWYSFLLSILAIVVFIGVFFNETYDSYLYDKQARIRFEHKTIKTDSLIQQLDENHFLKVKGITLYGYGNVYLDIVAIKADTIYCLEVPTKNDYLAKVKENIKEFYIPSEKADTLKIALNALKNSYPKNYDDKNNYKKTAFTIHTNTSKFKDKKYVFEDAFAIYDVDILVPNKEIHYDYRQKTYSFKVIVFDADLTLTKIENIGKSMNWINKLPEKPSFDNYSQRYYFLLKAQPAVRNTKLNVKLTFEDVNKKAHVFKVSKSDYRDPKIFKIVN